MSSTPLQVAPVTARIDLDVTAGDVFDVLIPILDTDGAAAVIPDLLGWSARGHIRRNVHAPTILHEFTTAGVDPTAWLIPAADNDGVTAVVRIYATAAVTAGWQQQWPAWLVGWDLDLTDPAGLPQQVGWGRVRLHPQYTR